MCSQNGAVNILTVCGLGNCGILAWFLAREEDKVMPMQAWTGPVVEAASGRDASG